MRDRWERLTTPLAPYAYVLIVAVAALIAVNLLMEGDRGTFSLAKPNALVLLGGGVLVGWVAFHLQMRRATFSFSRVADLRRSGRGVVSWLAPLPRALRVVAVGLIAIALARPQTFARQVVEIEGIDILLVLDLSKSMSERDLKRNRLDAAQRTIRRFIKNRTDRLGLVIFAKNAMLQCPLTLDMTALDRIVADLQIGDIDPLGTSIGDAVGLAVASLSRSDSRSKVIILLTDGDNKTKTVMEPEEAVAAAKHNGIKIFTVLMGDPLARRGYTTDPQLLKDMASESGGRFFHAGDDDALARGFEEVRATLEKSKLKEVRRVPTELYRSFVLPALALLLVEVLLSLTRLRRFP